LVFLISDAQALFSCAAVLVKKTLAQKEAKVGKQIAIHDCCNWRYQLERAMA